MSARSGFRLGSVDVGRVPVQDLKELIAAFNVLPPSGKKPVLVAFAEFIVAQHDVDAARDLKVDLESL